MTGAGTRSLKLAHLAFTALWIGGVAALWPIAAGVDPGDAVSARHAYLNLRAIAWNVVGWGGIGSLGSGVALGLLTPWGLFRRDWTVAKLCLTVMAIAFGMLFVERQMLAGLALLEGGEVTSDRSFHRHHARFRLGLAVQLLILALTAGLGVFKPSFRPPPVSHPGRPRRGAGPRAASGR